MTRIQDDLYMAINGDWQDNTVIPPDKSSIGADRDLTDNIEKQLRADFDALNSGKKSSSDTNLLTAAKLYAKAADFKTRDRLGIEPVLPRVHHLLDLPTLADFNADLPELIAQGYQMPLDWQVYADLNDASTNQINFGALDTILPDAALYKENPSKYQPMLNSWSDMASQLLLKVGLTAGQAAMYIRDALAFDARSAKYTITNEEAAEIKNLNNPCSWDDFVQQLAGFAFPAAVARFMPATPATVNEFTPKTFANWSTLLNEDNYHEFQHYAIIQELIGASGYLSNELRHIGNTYSRFLSGQEEDVSEVKSAYRLANAYMAEPIGIYYGKTYFGEDAKRDVTALVKRIIAAYKQQLSANTWLSASTKAKALRKLDTMAIKMGYPDKALPFYDQMHVEDKDDLLTTAQKLDDVIMREQLSRVGQPVNRGEWGMPGHLVNACYDPTMNDILFPAGILQPPYYSKSWSEAANLGGTGATIGHEISHAFDNNGALFDEYGNMKNWWTKDDEAAFAKITQQMIDQFDGLQYEGVRINGKLCVSENLADNAGMDVALSLLGDKPSKEELQEFFTAYTKSWRYKMRPELAKTVLMQDVHAPATLRVNIPVQNFDEWYQAYDVKPGDGMYRDPEKRIVVWDK
ncbi:M13-type metalloendopeptidase [Lacticaseibacillus zhaodongensis]|uniref:M13-type metalloendopeptidase n=1 Tax=Lacticaseibacillus zhaodongensis TaxID=2668065 RepID=UPI0012D309CD|nr:M13 family metallopeptidase [Lacticaseibacillus zhaodongensis]